MATYKYTVKLYSEVGLLNALDSIAVKLVGDTAESEWIYFRGIWSYLSAGEYTVTCSKSLGELKSVDLQKQWRPFDKHWFVQKVEVTSPEKKVFPIYHYIKRSKLYSFCEGKALKPSEQHKFVKYTRDMELKRRKSKYQWREYKQGWPQCIDADKVRDLPSEVQFSFTKRKDFISTAIVQILTAKVKTLKNWIWGRETFKSFEAIKVALKDRISTEVSVYVQKKWKDDAFFGYQCLNGLNPVIIRQCKSLPENFNEQVSKMVRLDLSRELEDGNIFVCDYKDLVGLKTSKFNDEVQHLAAPLVLLHLSKFDKKLRPVAIQLKQAPGENNPVFVDTDSEFDWLLAKIFVRSADFNTHQLNAHLLRTHLLAEVFTVALLRNVAKVHPLYKLLVPHTRFTLHINVNARTSLISENGAFPSFSAASVEGLRTLVVRSTEALTYRSLCIKDDIEDRGMESVPNYFYRDDGLKIWNIIHRFVNGVLTHYYKNDTEVKEDPELQAFIKDIFEHGFLSNKNTGIPQSFESVDELVKFVTMLIFTCSAQHAAVNNGQSQFTSWMPNTPTSLRRAPPTKKDEVTEETVLQTLPDRSTTQNAVSVVTLLSTQSSDFVPLGHYPMEHFTENVPLQKLKEFQEALKVLEREIDERNKDKTKCPVPYIYLKPSLVENSVSI